MTARAAIRKETERLRHFSDEADAEVRILFEYITGLDCVLAMINDAEVTDEQSERLASAVDRLIKGEPIQYVMGEWSFMGNDFEVCESVLIPRSDTEILCEQAAAYINGRDAQTDVLDICSGSGCIGISLAKLCVNSIVDCSDISAAAIDIINRNIDKNGVRGRVRAFCSDMFEKCGMYDVIVSNPPYIPSEDIDGLDAKVRLHEPRKALDGGVDGLDFYRIIAHEARLHLKDGGKLFLEIGYDQRSDVTDILKTNNYTGITCVKDYSGNDRVISCGV